MQGQADRTLGWNTRDEREQLDNREHLTLVSSLPPSLYTHTLHIPTHITHTTSSCQSRPQDAPKYRFCLLQPTLRHVTHTLPVLSPLPLLYPFTFPWIASFPALYIINSYPSSLPPFLAAPHHISWHHFPFPSPPPPDPSLDFSPPSPPSPNTSPWSLPLPISDVVGSLSVLSPLVSLLSPCLPRSFSLPTPVQSTCRKVYLPHTVRTGSLGSPSDALTLMTVESQKLFKDSYSDILNHRYLVSRSGDPQHHQKVPPPPDILALPTPGKMAELLRPLILRHISQGIVLLVSIHSCLDILTGYHMLRGTPNLSHNHTVVGICWLDTICYVVHQICRIITQLSGYVDWIPYATRYTKSVA